MRRLLSLALALVFSLGFFAASAEGADAFANEYNLDIWYYNYNTVDDVDMISAALSELTKPILNAAVTLHPIQAGQWTEKFNLALASGEKMDMAHSNGSAFLNYVASEAFISINPYLDYAKDALEVLGEDYAMGCAVNGELYGLAVNKEKARSNGYIFKKELVDKYNFDISAIKTYRDVEPMLETVAAGESGIDVLMLSGRSVGTFMDIYVEYVNNYNGGVLPITAKYDGITVAQDDYQLVKLYDYQPVVDLLNWANDMYNKGYVSRSAVTDSGSEIYTAGTWFCSPCELKGKGAKAAELSAQYGYEIVEVDIMEPYTAATQALGIIMCVPNTTEDPARAVAFINQLYVNADMMNTIVYGVQDTHYTVDGNGRFQTIENAGWGSQSWEWGNQFLLALAPSDAADKYTSFVDYNANAIMSRIQGFVFNKTGVADAETAVATVGEEYDKALRVGAIRLEDVYEEMMNARIAAGEDAILAEKQAQLNAFVAARDAA